MTKNEMEFIPSIEAPLRRKSVKRLEREYLSLLALLFGTFVLAILAFFAFHPFKAPVDIEPWVTVKGAEAVSLSSFCKQAKIDADYTGRELSESLREYCKF